jgi:hypothetical protein
MRRVGIPSWAELCFCLPPRPTQLPPSSWMLSHNYFALLSTCYLAHFPFAEFTVDAPFPSSPSLSATTACTTPLSRPTTCGRFLLGLPISIYFYEFLMNDFPTNTAALTSPVMAAMFSTDTTYCDDTQILRLPRATMIPMYDTIATDHCNRPLRPTFATMSFHTTGFTIHIQQPIGLIFAIARYPSNIPSDTLYWSTGYPTSDFRIGICRYPGGIVSLSSLIVPSVYRIAR